MTDIVRKDIGLLGTEPSSQYIEGFWSDEDENPYEDESSIEYEDWSWGNIIRGMGAASLSPDGDDDVSDAHKLGFLHESCKENSNPYVADDMVRSDYNDEQWHEMYENYVAYEAGYAWSKCFSKIYAARKYSGYYS